MTADDCDAGLARDRRAAFEDPMQNLGPEFFERERRDVERGQRRAAHRVDVGKRVCGRDAAEVERVVHDGREEVDRLDEREIVAQAVHSGIVISVEPDENVPIALNG